MAQYPDHGKQDTYDGPAIGPKSVGAVKYDGGKAPVAQGLLRFVPRACKAVASHWALGRKKYPGGTPIDVENGEARYEDAEVRHICDSAIEGEYDKDPSWANVGADEVLHATAKAWDAMVHLEIVLRRREAAGTPTVRPAT